jgi:hypothetical protein
LPGRAGDADRVGGEIEEHLAGERVVAWMQWRQPGGDVVQIVTTSKTAERDLDHGAPIVIGRAATASHTRTLRLSPRRPPVLAIASRNRWKERHVDDALKGIELRV